LLTRQGNFWAGLAFVAPALLIYLFYFIYPIPASAFYSLFRWDGISRLSDFRGIANWMRLIKDELFWNSFINNIIVVVTSLLIQLPLGLGVALIVSSKLIGNRFLKLIYFLPMMLSAVAIGMTWNYIYEPNYGLLNELLKRFGLEAFVSGWLGDADVALGAVIATMSWQYIPFYMVIFAAGLAGIPAELLESAVIDGANSFQKFLKIILPLLRGTIRTAAVLSLTGSLKYFALVFVMTEGGPNNATELMATYMYKQAFTSFNMGYGSTIALTMFFVAFVLTLFTLRLGRSRI
jgi:raffinose/stachyose/melibiose transport system permease protein